MSRRVVSIILVGVVAALAAGCATTGYKRANKAASSMIATRVELQAGRQQVTRTLNALNTLVVAQAGDLRPKCQVFDREVAQLRKNGENARRRANAMRRSTAVYFEEWGKEIEAIRNAEIRRESVKRRSETMRSYQPIEAAARDATAAYEPLLADLRDIQSHLKQDLTARGIAGIRGFVAKATQDAAALQQKIDAVVTVLDRVASEINAQAGTGR